jgi:DNA-binding GntR family transcriptional regulator
MSPAQAADRAYTALKQRLLGGAYPMGFRLEAGPIADDIHVSVTPVREALHRLAGQRLVSAVTGDGFYVPILNEAAIRDLLSWNAHLSLHALRGRHWPTDILAPIEQCDLAERAANLFRSIAAVSESGELFAAISLNNDRLAPLRKADGAIFIDVVDELSNMENALAGHNRELFHLLRTYHRRRKHAAIKMKHLGS